MSLGSSFQALPPGQQALVMLLFTLGLFAIVVYGPRVETMLRRRLARLRP